MGKKVRERGYDVIRMRRTPITVRDACTVCRPRQEGRVRHDEVWARLLAAGRPTKVTIDG